MVLTGKAVIWLVLLTACSITLGALLHAKGLVGYWGMLTVMISPQVGCVLLCIWRKERLG